VTVGPKGKLGHSAGTLGCGGARGQLGVGDWGAPEFGVPTSSPALLLSSLLQGLCHW
jgi:hypothetical protein